MTKEKGAVAILLSILVLSVLLVIGLTVSLVIINQLGMSTQAAQSVKAFYAADSGAEECFFQARRQQGACSAVGGSLSENLTNGANFMAQRLNETIIQSTGFFGKTSRRVELTW